MKRMKVLATLLMATLSLVLVGCSPEPIPEPSNADFKIEILSKNKTEVSFRITPHDMSTPYLVMIIDKATFDGFESEDDYIDDDLELLAGAATANEMSLEEYLTRVLKTGITEDSTDGLSPGTDYYLYAYHLTTKGEVVSALEKAAFTTIAFNMTDTTLEVSVSDIDYNEAVVNVVPSSNSAAYFVNIFDEDMLASHGGGSEAYKNHLVALREYYLGKGATAKQIIDNLCFFGSKSLKIDKLKVGAKHYAYAIGVDDECFPNTEAFVVEFTTKAAESSDLTFSVDVSNIFYDHIEGTIIPSNNEETYICSIQTAESLTWFENDEGFMEYLLTDIEYVYGSIENALSRGTTDLATLTKLNPDTEYAVVCFGYNKTISTELFTYKFKSAIADGNPTDLEVTFNIDYSSLTYNSVSVEAIPSVGAYYFMSLIPKGMYDNLTKTMSGDEAVISFANDEIDYGAAFYHCTRAEYLSEMNGAILGRHTMKFTQDLSPDTEYFAYAVAVDLKSGEVASSHTSMSEVFKTPEKIEGESTVDFVFDKYYDGTALAELDPDNFIDCKGCAVMPYTIVTTNNASAWYTGFVDGDYIEYGYDDDSVYSFLITYGFDWGVDYVSLNRESGVAVLPYNTPYSFLGIAKDSNGNAGTATIVVVNLSKEGVSPAQEFIDSLAK